MTAAGGVAPDELERARLDVEAARGILDEARERYRQLGGVAPGAPRTSGAVGRCLYWLRAYRPERVTAAEYADRAALTYMAARCRLEAAAADGYVVVDRRAYPHTYTPTAKTFAAGAVDGGPR